jgi:hypothetical protein
MNRAGRVSLTLVISMAAATSAHAAAGAPGAMNRCEQYVGQRVQPLSFADAVRPYTDLPVKSEFETTAQFEVRKAAALPGAGQRPLLIAVEEFDRKFLAYVLPRVEI